MAKGWLIGGSVFLGVLLVASIVVAVLQREEPLAQGTPEATVQEFLKATEIEDYQVAYGLLSEELKEECSLQDLVGERFPGDRSFQDARITLEDINTVDDITFVTVRITQFYGSGPFGTSESSFEQRYTLKQEDGEWRFTDYPWPFFNCGPFRPVPEPTVTPAPTREPASTPEPTAP